MFNAIANLKPRQKVILYKGAGDPAVRVKKLINVVAEVHGNSALLTSGRRIARCNGDEAMIEPLDEFVPEAMFKLSRLAKRIQRFVAKRNN